LDWSHTAFGHRIYEGDEKRVAAIACMIRSCLLIGNYLIELLRWTIGSAVVIKLLYKYPGPRESPTSVYQDTHLPGSTRVVRQDRIHPDILFLFIYLCLLEIWLHFRSSFWIFAFLVWHYPRHEISMLETKSGMLVQVEIQVHPPTHMTGPGDSRPVDGVAALHRMLDPGITVQL
jgi:hypothetical protein